MGVDIIEYLIEDINGTHIGSFSNATLCCHKEAFPLKPNFLICH